MKGAATSGKKLSIQESLDLFDKRDQQERVAVLPALLKGLAKQGGGDSCEQQRASFEPGRLAEIDKSLASQCAQSPNATIEGPNLVSPQGKKAPTAMVHGYDPYYFQAQCAETVHCDASGKVNQRKLVVKAGGPYKKGTWCPLVTYLKDKADREQHTQACQEKSFDTMVPGPVLDRYNNSCRYECLCGAAQGRCDLVAVENVAGANTEAKATPAPELHAAGEPVALANSQAPLPTSRDQI